MMPIDSAMEKCLVIAKGILLKDGCITPVAIFVKDEESMPILLKMRDQEEKEKYQRMVREAILQFRPDCVVVVCEAWMKQLKGVDCEKALDKYVPGSIAKDPERIEVITITGGSVDGVASIVQPFHTEGKKKRIVFDPVEKISLGVETEFFRDVWATLAAEEKGDITN